MAIKPVICGGTEVFVPECDPCDEFEYRVEALEECCDEARDTLADHEQRITANTNAIANKMDRLVAGENIWIDGDTINALNTQYDPATQSKDGLMTKTDKTKLDNLPLSIYPVGSTFVTYNETNPSTWLGGTWSQYDRYFRSQTLNNSSGGFSAFTPNSDYFKFPTSGSYLVATWLPTSIRFRIFLLNKVTIDPNAAYNVGTFDRAQLGITSQNIYAGRVVAYSGGSPGATKSSLYLEAPVGDTVNLVASSAPNALIVNTTFFIDFMIYSNSMNHREPSFCDKFFWRRTA